VVIDIAGFGICPHHFQITGVLEFMVAFYIALLLAVDITKE